MSTSVSIGVSHRPSEKRWSQWIRNAPMREVSCILLTMHRRLLSLAGSGSFRRMKAAMSSHIEQKGNTMFKQSANAVRTDLEALLLTTQSQINEATPDATDEKRDLWGCIISLASGVKHDFSPLAPLVAHFHLYIKPQDCNADLYVLRNDFRLMLILIPSILRRNKRRPSMGKAFDGFKKPSTLCSVCTMTSFMRMMWSLFKK